MTARQQAVPERDRMRRIRTPGEPGVRRGAAVGVVAVFLVGHMAALW